MAGLKSEPSPIVLRRDDEQALKLRRSVSSEPKATLRDPFDRQA
jgi:hypothetical protein